VNEITNPPINQLVRKIVTVNHAWKEAKLLSGDSESPIANSLRNLKTRLQIRLLRQYAPQQVYLREDLNVDYSEPVYGLSLTYPVDGHTNASHLPLRVAQNQLLAEEIACFCR
jgi:hypothetical protein